jgi:uncharacterized protein DUF6677
LAERETASPGSLAAAPTGNPFLACLLAWLVPGAGHFYLGRKGRGLAFFGLVLVALAVGHALDGRLYQPDSAHPLSYLGTIAEMGFGVVYFILRFAFRYQGELTAPGFEYGTTFLLTAGLMNLLLIFDAWDISLGKKS